MARVRGTGAPTLVDVAREAGVSLATASRALNGSSRTVAPEFRDRVLAAAERLRYIPNTAAQAVVRGRSNTLAFVVSDIADPYFAHLAGGLAHAAEAERMVVTIAATERDPQRELAVLRALRGQRPRAIVLAASRRDDADALVDELEAFADEGGRVVIVGNAGLPFPTVAFANRAGARELGERVAALGYRRAIVLGGPADLVTARLRAEGFVEGVVGGGLDPDAVRVVHGGFTRDGGHEAMGDVLDAVDRDTVVFAVNDVIAVGAMARAREAGLELPRDLAIAGFDDIATLRDVWPSLTTVRLPLRRAAESALALALDGASDAVVHLAGDVVVRDSTPAR